MLACGGGGLAGGIACAVDGAVRVVACETVTTNAYEAAVAAGRPVDVDVGGLAADALGATSIGELPWRALSSAGAVSAIVTDEQLRDALDWLWDSYRLVVEPSAATPIAALRSGAFVPSPGEHVGVLLCGANTTR